MSKRTPHDHHFVIDPPNGKVSLGICKHCGEARDFFNSYDKADYRQFSTKNAIPKSVDYMNNIKGRVIA